MNREERDLSVYVTQPRSEADLTRQWQRLRPLLDAPTPRRRRWLIPAAVVGLAGASALLMMTVRPRPQGESSSLPAPPVEQAFLTEGARVQNTGTETRTLKLADGSRIDLAPSAAVSLAHGRPDDLRIVLNEGSAAFDVTHVPERRFVVVVADAEVVVIGTRFVLTVSAGQQGPAASLSVQRGVVEVRRPRLRPVRFLAGQSGSIAAAPVVIPPPVEPAPSGPPVEPAPQPIAVGDKRAAAPDARRLFGLAAQARLQGKHREAAAILEKLCRLFPDDPSAPLAAFQLGRIHLDTLHDAGRAAASFHLAARLARDPTLRESAAAREIDALDLGGSASACRAARDAYREMYPAGPHLGRVSAACRDR
jgi:hypothetical protein